MPASRCQQCGRAVPEQTSVCPTCGQALVASPTPPAPAVPSPPLPQRIRRCAVCGRPFGAEHLCRLGSSARGLGLLSWRRRWGFVPVLRHDLYRAELQDRSGLLWVCSHTHYDRANAKACATVELRRLQDGTSDAMPARLTTSSYEPTDETMHWEVPGLTEPVWRELCAVFGDRCRYCGKTGALQRDHRVPMSRGGENYIGNIVPACAPCNHLKSTATEDEFLRLIRRLRGQLPTRLSRDAAARLAALVAKAPREPRGVTLLHSLRLPRHLLAEAGGPPHEAVAVKHGSYQPVAGTSFRQDVLEAVLRGREDWRGHAALIPEPTNPHDRLAVAVWVEGRQIGYVARGIAALFHRAIAEQLSVKAQVVATSAKVYRTSYGTAAALIRLGDYLDLGAP